MIRRAASILVLLTMLVLPQMAEALPREECIAPNNCVGPKESQITYTPVETVIVSSNGTFASTENNLIKGVQYRFKVSGSWRFGPSTGQQADMAFSTNDSWSSVTKSPLRSLEIAGQQQSSTPVTYSASHVYNVDKTADSDARMKFRIVDDNYSDGNTGTLSVEVLRANRVTYSSSTLVPLLGVPTIPMEEKVLVPEGTNDSLTGVVVPIQPIHYPGTPTIFYVYGENKPGKGYCFEFKTSGGAPIGPEFCLPNLINYQTPIPGYGVGSSPAQTYCDAGSCDVKGPPIPVPGVKVGPYSIPDQFWPSGLGPRPLQPGSGLQVTVDWTGDRDHLFLAASALGGPSQYSSYLPFDFTNPSEISWFQSNKDRLAAKINIAMLFPDGSLSGGALDGKPDPYYPVPAGVSIPGLGQFLEASFSSRVAGR